MASDLFSKRKPRGNGIFHRASVAGPTSSQAAGGRPSSKPLTKKGHSFTLSNLSFDASNSKESLDLRDAEAPGTPRSAASSYASSGMDDGTRAMAQPSSRPQLVKKSRPSSIFGSLRSFRSSTTDDDGRPATAHSMTSRASSFMGVYRGDLSEISQWTVLHHGEAQTNTGLFWRRKEYLVLLESHLLRFKSQSKAAEIFPSIPSGRGSLTRHGSSPSTESAPDVLSLSSESSGDKAAAIPMEHIVASSLIDDGRHAHAMDLSWLDPESGHGNTISLSFFEDDERDLWLRSIREISNKARLTDTDPLSPKLSEYAARVVEHEQDYDVTKFKIYKVVKRSSNKPSGRSASDDMMKFNPTLCFLVIGNFMVHLISLPKSSNRGPASAPTDLKNSSFGILTLTWVLVSSTDDSFQLAFRPPFQKPVFFQLASLASTEIVLQLRHANNALRPQWPSTYFMWKLPHHVDEDAASLTSLGVDDPSALDRTIAAFCVAYGVHPASIRYTISSSAEDGARFELLAPGHGNGLYSPLELLAIFRSLRYNESFGSISFSRINLDSLNKSWDPFGHELVCTHNRSGVTIQVDLEKQYSACLLIQEIRALAVCSRRLRSIDFTSSITSSDSTIGCGIPEALYPLCNSQLTNVDWITLNGVKLQQIDLEYLTSIAAAKASHLRALEVSGCGLAERDMTVLLDAFRSQENTLEVVNISKNPIRLMPPVISRQLDSFSFVRRLDLSDLSVTPGADALLPFETLATWRLEDLRLTGIHLNGNSVGEICRYLSHPRSEVLRELSLNNCSLTGKDVAHLLQSMTQDASTARLLHLDITDNRLDQDYGLFFSAIKRNEAPTHLTMRSIEYEEESVFRELILSLAANQSIRYVDISRASLPSEASVDTCKAIETLFVANKTIEDLDISGEEARLETCKLGAGINDALHGLKHNTTLRILRIQSQKLGLPGASALADVLRDNATLLELHCDNNNISLSGFTDLVNVLATNTSLLHLPLFEEGRAAALEQTRAQITDAQSRAHASSSSPGPTPDAAPSASSKISSMRRSLAASAHRPRAASRASARLLAVPQWTAQDVRAALRLVAEGWDQQVQRLQHFLERNWRFAADGVDVVPDSAPAPGLAPVSATAGDAQPRPATAGSIARVLETVALESTPTVEKLALLELPPAPNQLGEIDTTPVFENDRFDWLAAVGAAGAAVVSPDADAELPPLARPDGPGSAVWDPLQRAGGDGPARAQFGALRLPSARRPRDPGTSPGSDADEEK